MGYRGHQASDEARETKMPYLRLAGLSIAAALVLGLGSGAKAAPLSNSHSAIQATGVSSNLVIRTETAGADRRGDRRTDRNDRRNDRRR
jgi:hypothetical protein